MISLKYIYILFFSCLLKKEKGKFFLSLPQTSLLFTYRNVSQNNFHLNSSSVAYFLNFFCQSYVTRKKSLIYNFFKKKVQFFFFSSDSQQYLQIEFSSIFKRSSVEVATVFIGFLSLLRVRIEVW